MVDQEYPEWMVRMREWVRAEIAYSIASTQEGSDGYYQSAHGERDEAERLFGQVKAGPVRNLVRPLNEREKAVLAPLHPGDFGIPKEHWEAAQYYAQYWHENRKKAEVQ